MPYKDQEKQAAYFRAYRQKNKLRISEGYKRRRREGRPWVARAKQQAKDQRSKEKELVLSHYGAYCKCCMETRREFLTVDHINGGGNEHRRSLKGAHINRWLVVNNFPEGFRILCYNCNCARGYCGYCPHEREHAERAA